MPSRRREVRVRHRRRADRVDPDAERRALDRHRLGELVHTALGRPVDGAAPAHEPGDGSGVQDDPAVALLLELDHGVLAAEEHAAQVHGDEPVEVVDGVLFEAHAEPGRRDADVVEEDVEASEVRRPRPRSCSRPGRPVRRHTRPRPRRHRRLRPGAPSPWPSRAGGRRTTTVRAFLGEAQRRRAADARTGARDDC